MKLDLEVTGINGEIMYFHYLFSVQDTGDCIKGCLKDWTDPTLDVAEEPEYDFGIESPTDEVTKENKEMTQKLFTFFNYEYDPVGNMRADMNIFSVLREAVEVLEKHCRAPYVQPEFLEHVFAALHFVVIKAGDRTKINDLGAREHSLIIDGLRRCKDNPMKFHINGSTCGGSNRVRPRCDS